MSEGINLILKKTDIEVPTWMSKSCKSLDALLQITALSSPSVQHLELERKGIASDLGQADHGDTGLKI